MARLFEGVVYKRLKGVIVPNEFLQEEIKKRRCVTPAIIRNPCEEIPDDILPKEPITLTDKEIRMVYTGAVYHVNFGAFKNLITAISRIERWNIKLHLYTAQPADWIAQQGISGDHVVIQEHVPHDEVVGMQNKAHILLVPFSFDSPVPEIVKTSAPGKLGDYLACGTPILALVPPDSFVSWYFKKYGCGVVVDSEDPAVLVHAIENLLSDGELQKKISQSARERACQDFDPFKSRNELLSLLEIK